ncbi:MAG: tetratricopeptide repeat protein, partial [bacterium]|nr:tetratricopeptide repeat protein [bacterium]
MAVTIIALSGSGCVTSRHIDELKAEIRDVEAQTRNTQDMMIRMDSVINAGDQSNAKLRNDVIMAVDEIQEQMSALLENYNDLLIKINQLGQKETTIYLPPTDSPGAQTDKIVENGTNGEMPRRPTIDCEATYDDGFVMTRSGEYDGAMEAFDKFLLECPNHENIENAYYWYGECYYALEKYTEAIEKFNFLAKEHKNSPKAG